MYRDGSCLIAVCIVGLVLYGAALGLVLPDATVAFAPDQPAAGVLDVSSIDNESSPYPNLSGDEIGNDPDLPTNYTVDRSEEVGPALPK